MIPVTIQTAWDSYTKHLHTYFYNPDTEAVRIALTVAASHFHKNCDPIWLFVLGPSSGDKTSIVINSLQSLPEVHPKGELTSKTFLSGYTGTAHPSLLHQIGSGIITFKDFTTFMSKRPEDQAEIASQLREIADGSFNKDTGKGLPLKWQGKITVIAAATPALERAWATRRDLGERFLQVRINRKDGMQQAEFAQRQRGKEEFISGTMQQLAKAFFQATPSITNPPPNLSNEQMSRVAAMSEIVTHCRGSVPRHPITNAICDLPQIENSGRLPKALASLISNHAALFRRTNVEEEDMEVGRRVALNTIPAMRSLVVRMVPIQGCLEQERIGSSSGLPESTLSYLIADLEALGVIRVKRNEIVSNEIALTPLITKLWNQAFGTPTPSQPQERMEQPAQVIPVAPLGIVH
jgi:uncharacterized membrane protein